MSFFRKAGKKFEETKQNVLGDAESGYVCRSCEEVASEDYEYCPHCGEASLEPVE